MTERTLTPSELRALCQLIFGESGAWKEQAAVALNVSKRNLDYWLSEDGYPTPPGILPDLMAIAGRKLCEEGERVRMWRQHQRKVDELRLLFQALEQGPQRDQILAQATVWVEDHLLEKGKA